MLNASPPGFACYLSKVVPGASGSPLSGLAITARSTLGRGFAALALVVMAGGLEASEVRRLTLEQMAVRADQIFTGEVVGIKSQLNARRTGIHTFVTIEVDEYLKGGRRKLLTLRFLGGDAEGYRSVVPESHGEHAFFFPFGAADTDFSVTVHPQLVVVADGQATEVNLEVSQ